MTTPDLTGILDQIAGQISALNGQNRRFIALAGPPAVGKSTISHALRDRLGPRSAILPMDGFHYSNAILEARGLRPRKGAPESFDLAGFHALLHRLRTEKEVAIPTFDRDLDCAIGSSEIIAPEHQVILVEGNYLLLDEPGWRDLSGFWDLKIFLDAPIEVLETRLINRWLSHGFDQKAATAKAQSNDIPNARRVVENHIRADLVITN